MRYRWRFLLFMSLLAGAGFLISGAPQPVDLVTRSSPAIGQYLIFIFWWVGLLGWGEFFARKLLPSLANPPSLEGRSLSTEFVLRLSLGSVAASFFVGSLSLILPYGGVAKYWASLLVLLGIFNLAAQAPLLWRKSYDGLGRWSKILLGVLFVAILMRTFEAYRMIRHGDQYAVYLTGPRLWFDAHNFEPFLTNPLQFLTSTWDYLSMWGNFFFAGAPGEGLDAAQRFSQWTTVTVAYVGVTVALYAVFSEALSSAWILLACVAATSIPSLNWTATLAKSDMGVCFWSITALLLLFPKRLNARSAFTGGLLLGAAVMAKPSAVVFAFFAAALSVLRLAWETEPRSLRQPLKMAVWLTLGGILAASPVLIRNSFLTGNPFYPWLGSIFPSDLAGPTLTQGFSVPTVRQFKPDLATYWSYLREVLHDNPFNAFSLLCLIPRLNSRVLKIPNRLSWFTAAAWLAALAFDWKLRPATELRYLGPALPLIAALGILSAGYTLQAFAQEFKLKWLVPVGGTALALYLIATSQIPLHVVKRIPKGYFIPAAQDVLDHDGGKAKQWMRKNVRNHDLILALSDNYFYYTLGLNYIEVQHYKPTDATFSSPSDGRKMIELMDQLHARYFHHLKGIGGPLKPILESLPLCRVYDDPQARIYDVACLVAGSK